MLSSAPYDLELVRLLVDSHQRLLGRPLEPSQGDSAELARYLFEEAPYCLLAHDASSDPRFIYVNRAVLACFEYELHELLGMPSRLSAEAPLRDEREALLRSVRERGYAEGYRGVRIAKSGRRFWIEDVTVWNLLDAEGVRVGQAATYRRTTPA